MTTLQVPIVRVGSVKGAAVEVEIPESLKVVSERPQGHGMFRILTKDDGDQRVVWNNESLAEIREAKKMFDNLVGKGLVPYKVGDRGKATPEVMQQFDPAAEEVIFLPVAMAAGG